MALFLVLAAGYEAAVRSGRVPAGEGLDNVAHGDVRAETVFIGSSLTHNLPLRSPELNLGVRGESSCLGAAILERSPLRPRTVIVEMNTPLLRGTNQAVVDRLFNPSTFGATSALWSLREDYRPFGVLSNWYQSKRPTRDPAIPERIRAEAIRKQLRENDRLLGPVEKQRLSAALGDLKHSLKLLTERGVAVKLVWIPGEPAVERTRRVEHFRFMVEHSSVGDSYPWITVPARSWRTNDGVHLIPSQAKELAQALSRLP